MGVGSGEKLKFNNSLKRLSQNHVAKKVFTFWLIVNFELYFRCIPGDHSVDSACCVCTPSRMWCAHPTHGLFLSKLLPFRGDVTSRLTQRLIWIVMTSAQNNHCFLLHFVAKLVSLRPFCAKPPNFRKLESVWTMVACQADGVCTNTLCSEFFVKYFPSRIKVQTMDISFVHLSDFAIICCFIPERQSVLRWSAKRLVWPGGLTVDLAAEKLFWTDASEGYIAYCDFDGDNVQVGEWSMPARNVTCCLAFRSTSHVLQIFSDIGVECSLNGYCLMTFSTALMCSQYPCSGETQRERSFIFRSGWPTVAVWRSLVLDQRFQQICWFCA